MRVRNPCAVIHAETHIKNMRTFNTLKYINRLRYVLIKCYMSVFSTEITSKNINCCVKLCYTAKCFLTPSPYKQLKYSKYIQINYKYIICQQKQNSMLSTVIICFILTPLISQPSQHLLPSPLKLTTLN